MKLQFSLATLLVCVTVLAVIAAVAAGKQIHEVTDWRSAATANIFQWIETDRSPNVSEIAWRMLIWGVPSVVATLAMLWVIRRLKSRRHTEPPVDRNSTSVAQHAAATVN